MQAAVQALFVDRAPEAEEAPDVLACVEAAIAEDYTKIPSGTDPLSQGIARLIAAMLPRQR